MAPPRTPNVNVVIHDVGLPFFAVSFVLVGANGAVLQTVDGSRFFTSGVPGTEQLNAVTFGNQTFVTVGSDEKIFASLDGVSWGEVHR